MRQVDADTRLPDFLVIGPPRTGTTWLHRVLRAAPGVYVPPCKQVHYFDKKYEMGEEWYRSFFSEAKPTDKVGEVTPDYATKKEALERIRATLPNAKLVLIFRDPLERAYSHFRIRARKGEYGDRGFADVFEEDIYLLKNSLYYNHLQNVLELFKPGQLLILDYSSIKKNPEGAILEVFRHIGGGKLPSGVLSERYSVSISQSRVEVIENVMVRLRSSVKGIIYKLEGSYIETFLRRLYRTAIEWNSITDENKTPMPSTNSLKKLAVDQQKFRELAGSSAVKFWKI